jgi:hypothetical protein
MRYRLDAMMQKYADNYDAMLEKNRAYSGGDGKQRFVKAGSWRIK